MSNASLFRFQYFLSSSHVLCNFASFDCAKTVLVMRVSGWASRQLTTFGKPDGVLACLRASRDRDVACPTGIEPVTHSLEGCCSIQLSYGQIRETAKTRKALNGPFCIWKWSERRDSNSRPSAPKADALPGCATLRLAAILPAKAEVPGRFSVFRIAGCQTVPGGPCRPPAACVHRPAPARPFARRLGRRFCRTRL